MLLIIFFRILKILRVTYLPHSYLCYYLNNQILNILKPSRTIKPKKYMPISMLPPCGLKKGMI